MTRYPTPYWDLARNNSTQYSPVTQPVKADVIVIGAGITGLMTAYELKRKGASVVVLEKDRIGTGESNVTTAHLTCVTDLRLSELIDSFGKDHASAVWDAGAAATEHIHDIVHRENIECSFLWVPGFFCSSLDNASSEDELLRREADIARAMGFESKFVESVPFVKQCGIRIERQAKFHPLQFLQGLAGALEASGRCVYEESEVTEISASNNSLVANGYTISADTIVMATHVPLQGRLSTSKAALFQTKLYPYTSYVVRAELQGHSYNEALLWDTSDPYYYLRIDRDGERYSAIFGGLDNKTGHEEGNEKFKLLEDKLRSILPVSNVTHHWAGQVIETNDGLPFIGEIDKRQFIATGYSGNGFTFGTVAALVISDAVSGRKNPWTDLFHPGRTKLKDAAWDYIKENIDYPYYMAKQYLVPGAKKGDPSSLKLGEGAIFAVGDTKVAACRSKDGELYTVSPKCTHMGCFVKWNSALESWDCPCHGSRFAADGSVLGGPAEENLTKLNCVDSPDRTLDCRS